METEQIKPFLRIVFLRCMKVLGNREDALDAMQDVMVRYYDARQKRTIDDPLSYLCRMSMNQCIDRLQSSRRTVPLELVADAPAKGPSVAKAAEGQWMLSTLLRILSKEETSLLLHRHVEQMTFAEIGRLYGLSDRGLQKKLTKIEQRVQRFIQEPGGSQ